MHGNASRGEQYLIINHIVITPYMFKTSIQFALRLGNGHSADIATWNIWLSQDYLAFQNLVLDASATLPGCRAGRPEIVWPENERGTIYRKLPAPCAEEDSKENNGENLL